MDDLVARLAFQGASVATILQALEEGYAAGRFPFVPRRETVSRVVAKKLQLYGVIRQHVGLRGPAGGAGAGPRYAGAGWVLPGPGGAELGAQRAPDAANAAARGGGERGSTSDPGQDRAVLAALPAVAARGAGQWPDAETVRWWAYLAARAPGLPAADLPDLAALWRARLAEGRPVRDLVLFLGSAPWRGERAFDAYVRAVAGAGERLYPQWRGFLPAVARWLAAVAHDLWQIANVLHAGGPALGGWGRAWDAREWVSYARDRWAAARAAFVPLLPLVWQGLVTAAPAGAPGAAIATSLDSESASEGGEPLTENWFWRQIRRSDVLLAPPLDARSPVGQAWRWRSATVGTWTALGPHEPVRVMLVAITFDLARAVVALDRWATAGFPVSGPVGPEGTDTDGAGVGVAVAPRLHDGDQRDTAAGPGLAGAGGGAGAGVGAGAATDLRAAASRLAGAASSPGDGDGDGAVDLAALHEVAATLLSRIPFVTPPEEGQVLVPPWAWRGDSHGDEPWSERERLALALLDPTGDTLRVVRGVRGAPPPTGVAGAQTPDPPTPAVRQAEGTG